MIEIVNVADLVDPNDPDGRSYRQINAAREHQIPVGSLVEMESGARMFVVMHTRDCDMEPLYSLCADPEDTEQEHPSFGNMKWHNGYGEEQLTVVPRRL